MGVQFNQGPDAYAEQYATQNNISVDAAKQELKTKYGDPQQQGNDVSIFSSNSTTSTNSTDSKPDPSMDPDEFAQIYADEHGITLEEAKAKLAEMYGDPEQPNQSGQSGQSSQSGIA